MKLSPEAARLFEKILGIGPSYFDLATPFHARLVALSEQMLRADSVAEIRRLNDEYRQISAQLDSIGEPKQ